MPESDVWAGIPVELREKVTALRFAVAHAPWTIEETQSSLLSVLRSLVSRLQEAETENTRLKDIIFDMTLKAGNRG